MTPIPLDARRTQYSSAINGTDRSADVAQVGHSRHILLVGLRRPHGSAGYCMTVGVEAVQNLCYSPPDALCGRPCFPSA